MKRVGSTLLSSSTLSNPTTWGRGRGEGRGGGGERGSVTLCSLHILHRVNYSMCASVWLKGERRRVCVCACMRVCVMFNANVSTCKLHVLKVCELECG